MIALLLLLACGSDDAEIVAELQSENAVMRQDAVADVSDGGNDVRTAVEGLLDDPDPRIRLEAVKALDRLGDGASAPVLARAVRDVHPDVRKEAIDTLGRLADPVGAPALTALLQQQAANPPLNAIWALGEIADPQALPILSKLRDHPSALVRYQADEALRKL